VALTGLGLLAAYLIGAIPVGFLVARAAGGTDIRRSGSGNIGATNVLRALGKGPAVLTLLGDIVNAQPAYVKSAPFSYNTGRRPLRCAVLSS